MTHILLNQATYNAAMYPGTPQTVTCPACNIPVQITKIRTGMVRYTCSCGANGMVFVDGKAVAR